MMNYSSAFFAFISFRGVTMFVSVALLLITVTVVFLNHFKLMRKHRWLRQFQGPSPTFPIIGNALEFVGHPSGFAETYHNNFKKFGSVWKVWLMDEPTLVTAEPELLKILLGSQNHLDKHFIYEYGVKIILGEYGLITSESKQWKMDRKLLNQSYRFEYLEKSFKQCVNDWPKLQNKIEATMGRPIEFLPMLRKFYLEIILKSFDVNPSIITENLLSDVEDVFESALELAKLRLMKPWTRNSLFWKIFGYQRKLENMHQQITTHISGIFADLESQNISKGSANTVDTDIKTKRTLNNIIGDSEAPFQWRYDHLVTFAGAVNFQQLRTWGTDTAAVTTTMTLFFLALNPDCQKKAQEEIDLLFEERKDGELSFSDLSNLRYLRMCVKEAMRLHAPAPFVGRTTSEDILLEDGRKIPKGTSVLVIISELHMNPETFPDPRKFDPERFNETNSLSIKPYTYIPFSAGPRNCIGQKYAECVLTRVVAQILRRFSVRTHQKAEDIKILFEIAGTPYPNVEITFDKRS